MTTKVQVGEFGFLIDLQVDIDITGIDDYRLVIKRPDNSVISRLSSDLNLVANNPGLLTYAVQDGDLTIEGLYEAQVFMGWDSPAAGLISPIASFYVYSDLATAFWDA